MTITAATIRKTKARLLVPLLALLFLSTIDRSNVSFAALQMNEALGLSPEAYGFGVSILGSFAGGGGILR